jgi:mRNA-degrading endonuclease RelE of RelBE toxin-antitoxin system
VLKKYRIELTEDFTTEYDCLTFKSQNWVDSKIEFITNNPFHAKRLVYKGRMIFRIRFADNGLDKRLIYEVEGDLIIFHRILDRKNDYRDLDI